jgi:hypothetical protein
MHAGKRKSPRAAEKVEEQAKELVKKLEEFRTGAGNIDTADSVNCTT